MVIINKLISSFLIVWEVVSSEKQLREAFSVSEEGYFGASPSQLLVAGECLPDNGNATGKLVDNGHAGHALGDQLEPCSGTPNTDIRPTLKNQKKSFLMS